MKKEYFLFGLILVLVAFISLVSNHSVQEIHYLKSFFPEVFTVEEAKDAAIIELVKILIIFLPVTTIILICWKLLNKNNL